MRIVVLVTEELPRHTLFFISEDSDESALISLETKYGLLNLRVLYSAIASYEYRIFPFEDLKVRDVDSIRKLPPEVEMFLKSHTSPIGDEVFRCDPRDLVELCARFFQKRVVCDSSLKSLVVKIAKETENAEREHRLKQTQEQEFLKTFEVQCRELNAMWESRWDKWVIEFVSFIGSTPFPKLDDSLWGRERKRQEFSLLKSKYLEMLLDLTRRWRDETRQLPTTFLAKCRYCGGNGEVKVSAGGPGNKQTYGGSNWNTVAKEQGKSATVECGRKVMDGRKYFYRSILGFTGACEACGQGLFQKEEYSSSNYARFDWNDKWCVFPFYDVESWWEWCGIWMTIYDWESHTKLPYEARDVSYEFFKDFDKVVDIHWKSQYPRPQLPKS